MPQMGYKYLRQRFELGATAASAFPPSESFALGQRCVLGIPNSYGGEGPPLKVLTSNVSALTWERLHAVLQQASDSQVAVTALQETKHPACGFRWVSKMASDA